MTEPDAHLRTGQLPRGEPREQPIDDERSPEPLATRSQEGARDQGASAGRGGTGARFVTPGERARERAALEAARVLVVSVDGLGASARGRLADVIEEAIERELDARGAAPPGIGSSSDADAALSDQLFRARRVGASGLALLVGALRGATSPRGALEAEDSATLRFWADATRERPIALLLDADDAHTGAYGDPVPLAELVLRDEATTPMAVPGAPQTPEPVAAAPATASAAKTIASAHAPSPQIVGASVAVESDAWRHWTLSLTAARGPQPLGAFEKLFAVDYMPLANAISAGLDDSRALHAWDEFRRTFSRSYGEACPTFAVTGKRPRMVLDAPDVAARIARLHGARTTQLLLVDAMRFDLGAMVKDELVGTFGSRASLTDETLLWSALPTTSARQLETLSRGVDALRSSSAENEREADPLRGRTAEMIRRIKIGSRDVYKLDLVEARLRELTTHALPALPEIAGDVADAISRHAMTLQARTLLFVFGDHGFTLDRDGAPHAGGASPEEVLVPAFAFLVGETH
jgi:hypothetical protein